MPAAKWTTDRTEQKFRYAHIHLEELVNYSARGSNNDWEHAHEEACMYHLVGAIEGTFQEMNTAYALGLKLEDAKLSVLGGGGAAPTAQVSACSAAARRCGACA